MSLQIANGLVISSICVTGKCNAVGALDIIPKDEKKIYLRCLRGHTYNLADGGILARTQTPNDQKMKSTRNHLRGHDKKLR